MSFVFVCWQKIQISCVGRSTTKYRNYLESDDSKLLHGWTRAVSPLHFSPLHVVIWFERWKCNDLIATESKHNFFDLWHTFNVPALYIVIIARYRVVFLLRKSNSSNSIIVSEWVNWSWVSSKREIFKTSFSRKKSNWQGFNLRSRH